MAGFRSPIHNGFGSCNHKPSPAMMVALLALLVALGGTSYAAVQLSKNSVLSKHIKNGEVKRPDLAKNAVTARTVANGSLLAADFKAGELPQGPNGDPGATRVTVRTAYGTGIVSATCQPGEVATGGGGHSPQPDGVVIASAPLSHPQAMFAPPSALTGGFTATTWQARAVTVTVTGDPPAVTVLPAEVITWIVCAAP